MRSVPVLAIAAFVAGCGEIVVHEQRPDDGPSNSRRDSGLLYFELPPAKP